MKLSFFFAWYDLWVGAYYDRKVRVLYVCPLPCCVMGGTMNDWMTFLWGMLVGAILIWLTQ